MRKLFYIFAALLALTACKTTSSVPAIGESENGTCILVAGQYLTPDMFGAKGDGKTDDTEALRQALFMANQQGKVLFIPSEKNYRIKGCLNYYQGKYQAYSLNILGTLPIKQGSYSPGVNGGISVEKGVSVFMNASMKGTIERVCITGKRDDSVRLFDNCTCSNLQMHGCNVSNFGAIFYDTNIKQVSEITYNTFLTAFYFSRNEKTSSGMMDSRIAYNYINGGKEKNDNVCFEWSYFNGSDVTNNFIDYYRTIYQPKATAKQAFVGPNSTANQYQVFRYLYYPGDNINTINFCSYGDCFNWNDPSTLDKLAQFAPIQSKGKDGKMYDLPSFIGMCSSAWKINIVAAKLERNIGNVVYVHSSLTEYETNEFNVEFIGLIGNNTNRISYRQGDTKPFYNSGKYMANRMRIKGLKETAESLPKVATGWSKYPAGYRIVVAGKTYELVNSETNGKWSAQWTEIDDNE